MKLGICGFLSGKDADGREFDFLSLARGAGFDYVEWPLSTLAGLSEEDFSDAVRKLKASGMACEACNLFFPGTLRLTGAGVKRQAIREYLEHALARAGQLGVHVVVFGSGGARRAPEGFPKEQAWVQLVEMLRSAGEIAKRFEITIAIEPLNRDETNLIHTAAEGFALARLVDHPSVRLLLDIYHMVKENEDFGIARTARGWLAHAHFAEPNRRTFPAVADETGRAFFEALIQSGYTGRVSLEAGYANFEPESQQALKVMRELAR